MGLLVQSFSWTRRLPIWKAAGSGFVPFTACSVGVALEREGVFFKMMAMGRLGLFAGKGKK